MPSSGSSEIPENEKTDGDPTALSYKFQRLRERLRESIVTGDLAGKLPGERTLAKRFHVNAKTLSKALTDLAAEGLLDRSIGRGTYVKGSAPAVATAKRWLAICDPGQTVLPLIDLLRRAHPDLDVTSDLGTLRPSFLNQFSAVIVLSREIPDSFIRDLVVRNTAVVAVGDEPRAFSTHAVITDAPLAVSLMARDLLVAGHRRFAAVEAPSSSMVANMIRQVAIRFGCSVNVDSCSPADAQCLVQNGITALVCDSLASGILVKETLEKRQMMIPRDVSVVAVGCQTQEHLISGYYTGFAEKAQAILTLLQQNSARPTTIWLSGRYVDCKTMVPLSPSAPGEIHSGMLGNVI